MTPTVFVQPEPQAAARLHGRVVTRQTLDARTRDAMFALLASHFVGVDRTTFDRDLDEKSCAILLEDDAGVLRGFSTMLVYESVVGGTAVSVIYSGDTIVERSWWGSPVLARTWIATALNAAPAGEAREVYWLLLSQGSHIPNDVFFREFYIASNGKPAETRGDRRSARDRFGGQVRRAGDRSFGGRNHRTD